MRHALENVIPSAAPLHVVLLAKGDRVAVGDGGVHRALTLDGQGGLQSFRVATVFIVMGDGSEISQDKNRIFFQGVRLKFAFLKQLSRSPGSYLDRNNPPPCFTGTEILPPIFTVTVMIGDNNVHVVEHVVVVSCAVVSRYHTGVLWVSFLVNVAAHREAC